MTEVTRVVCVCMGPRLLSKQPPAHFRYVGNTSRRRHDPQRDDCVDQNDVDGH